MYGNVPFMTKHRKIILKDEKIIENKTVGSF